MMDRILSPGFLYVLGMKATHVICIALVFEGLVWVTIRWCDRMLRPVYGKDAGRETGLRVRRRNRLRDLSRQGIRGSLYLIALLMILDVFGVSMQPLYWGLLLLTLIFGWAARDVLAETVSGFVILCNDQIAVGDTMEVEGARGVVEEMNYQGIRLKDEQGVERFVSNRKAAGFCVRKMRVASSEKVESFEPGKEKK